MLTEEQVEIRSVSRAFLEARFPSTRVRELMTSDAGFDREDWREIADLGWPGIALAEDRGGAGLGVAELCVLVEEMGRIPLGDPFFATAVLVGTALGAASSGSSAAAVLSSVVDGTNTAALVARGDLHSGPTLHGAVEASLTRDGHALSGAGGITVGAPAAEVLIVAAQLPDGTTGLFETDPTASAVRRGPERTIDPTRRSATVGFDAAPAKRLDGDTDVAGPLERAMAVGTLALSAEMVGGAQRCLEMTLGYLREREQFGVAIGSFQALKHRMADTSLMIDGARELVMMGAAAADSGDERSLPILAAAAKSAASDAAVHASQETIQLHGAIGFTWEHDAHLFYRRAVVSAATLGTATDHRERIANALLAR